MNNGCVCVSINGLAGHMQVLHVLRGQNVGEGGADAAERGQHELEQRLRNEAVRRVGRLVLRDKQHRLHQDVDRAAHSGPRARGGDRVARREQEPAGRRQVQPDAPAYNRQREGHREEQDHRDARDRRQENGTRHESVRVSRDGAILPIRLGNCSFETCIFFEKIFVARKPTLYQ